MASLGDVNKALPYLTLTKVKPPDQELGHGAYGRVFKVNYHGTVYAAKEIHSLLIEMSNSTDKQKIKDNFLLECYQCSTLNHPNTVKFVGIHYSKEDSFLPIMIMKLMGESLTKYICRKVKYQYRYIGRASFCMMYVVVLATCILMIHQ